jgi:predicted MPP superfamily phosphohydrolase
MTTRKARNPAQRRGRGAATRVALGLLGAVVLLAVYGVAIEPRLWLDEEHHPVPLPGLPVGAPPVTVAAFSDLQVGMWLSNEDMIRDIVDRVVEERPAAALIGGDYVIGTDPPPTEQIDRVVALLAPLPAAGIPTYGVLGNHDFEVGAADQVTTALEGIGIRILRNEAAVVPDAAGLRVVGVGADRPDRENVAEALDEVPADAPRVVLVHNPTTFRELAAGRAPLAVAGHTHCGQVTIPGLPAWSWVELTAAERIAVDGWADEGYGAPGNRLFVTCGIGFSLVPARIAAPPQVVFFDLQPVT